MIGASLSSLLGGYDDDIMSVVLVLGYQISDLEILISMIVKLLP